MARTEGRPQGGTNTNPEAGAGSDHADTTELEDTLKKAEKKATQVFCDVLDMNQRGDKPRVHDIIVKIDRDDKGEILHYETVSYALYSQNATKVPLEHAFKFLVDAAFIVKGPNGHRIMPVAKHDESRPLASLREDELVVNIDELSDTALLRRVKVLPGSEGIAANATHGELVTWLKAWKRTLRGAGAGATEMAERLKAAGFDDIPPTMLEKLLPKSSLVERAS